MKTYHVGLLIDYRKEYTGRVIVQMRQSVDFLDCGIWKYLGERVTTKKAVYEKRIALLDWINRTYSTAFTRIAVE